MLPSLQSIKRWLEPCARFTALTLCGGACRRRRRRSRLWTQNVCCLRRPVVAPAAGVALQAWRNGRPRLSANVRARRRFTPGAGASRSAPASASKAQRCLGGSPASSAQLWESRPGAVQHREGGAWRASLSSGPVGPTRALSSLRWSSGAPRQRTERLWCGAVSRRVAEPSEPSAVTNCNGAYTVSTVEAIKSCTEAPRARTVGVLGTACTA